MSLYPKLNIDYGISSPYRNRLPANTKFTFSAPIGDSPTRASERASPIRPVRDGTPISERLAARRNLARQSPVKTRGLTRTSINEKPQETSSPVKSASRRPLQTSPPKLFPSPQPSHKGTILSDRDNESDKENLAKKRRKVVLFQNDKEIKTYHVSGGKPDIHSVVASLQDIVKRMQSDHSMKIAELEARINEQDKIISRLTRRERR
jgi:hypothetical protein